MGLGTIAVTLRFRDSRIESAFLEYRRSKLIARSKLLLALFALWTIGELSWYFISHQPENDLSRMQVSLATTATGLLWYAVLASRCLVRNLRVSVLEVAGACLLVVFMTLRVFSNQWCQVVGTPAQINSCGLARAQESDSFILLTIDSIITVSHMCLPIRWFAMVPLQLAALVLYALRVALVGSGESLVNALYNELLLAGLVVAASISKRHAEIQERNNFLEGAHNKCVRCEGEFRLAHTRAKPGTRSMDSMGGMTTQSGPVFDPLCEGVGELGQQLAMVAAMAEAERWLISAKEVQILPAEVGTGGFGVVSKGIFCGMLVAVKCPLKEVNKGEVNTATLRSVQDLCNEMRVLRHLRHPNIVITHGAVVLPEEHQIMLVSELVSGAILHDYLTRNMILLPSNEAVLLARYKIMIGLCRALLYMHSRCPHIVHGDVKSENVMVEILQIGLVQPKLLDFGLSRVITHAAKPLGGTTAWMAPEAGQKDAPVKCSADVYSFGYLLAFIATSSPPQVRQSVVAGADVNAATAGGSAPKEEEKRLTPTWPANCAFEPCCRPMVDACLRTEEEKRPTILDLHDLLLAVPDQLGFVAGESRFIQDVQVVAAHSKPQQEMPVVLSEARPQHAPPVGMRGPRRLLPGQSKSSSMASFESLEAQSLGLRGNRRLHPGQSSSMASLESLDAHSSSLRESRRLHPAQSKSSSMASLESLDDFSLDHFDASLPSIDDKSRSYETLSSDEKSPYPAKSATQQSAMETTIMQASLRWNTRVPGVCCCEKHAWFNVARDVCSQARTSPCSSRPTWMRQNAIQCAACGILGIEGQCDVCRAPCNRGSPGKASL